jgi:hypothetical protein
MNGPNNSGTLNTRHTQAVVRDAPESLDTFSNQQLVPKENDYKSAPITARKGSVRHRAAGLSLLGIGIIAGTFLVMHNASVNKRQTLNANSASSILHIRSQSIALSALGLQPLDNLLQTPSRLTVNGQLVVDGSVVLAPTVVPHGAVAGQLYYDQQKNQLGYYNNKGFVYLQGGISGSSSSNVTNVSNVYNVTNVSNVSNISNFTNSVTGPLGVIPMFNGSGLSDSLMNEAGNGVGVGVAANTSTRLTIAGATSDGTTDALTVTNNAGDVYEQVLDNGLINLGKGPSPLFGDPTVEPTKDNGIAGIITADKFTTSGNTTITSMSVYVGNVGTAPYNEYQLGIYADNGGAPGAWVASSAVDTLTANAWNTLPVSATLAAGTSYWLAYTTSSNNSNTDDPYYAITSSPTHAYASFSFGSGSESGMPAVYPTPTTVNNYTHSIYATVAGNGSALTVDPSGGLTANGTATFKDINPSSTAFQVQSSGGSPVLNVDTTDNSVSIGTATPTTARLSVVGATNDNTSNAFSVTSSTGVSLAQVGDDGSVNLGESRPVFGSSSSGNYTGGGYYNAGQQLLQAQSFTTTSGGAISSISTYVGQAISGTNNSYQMAVYKDNAGVPGAYMASTAVGTLTGSGWNTLPITTTLAASTKYWLVYWTNTNDDHNGQNFISGYSGPNTFYQAFATWQSGGSNGMPTTFPMGSGPSGGYETSIYASYANPVTAVSIDASGNLTSNGNILIQNSSSDALDVTDATGGTALYVDGGSHFVGVNTSNTNGFNFVVSGTSAFGGVYNTEALRIVNASGVALLNADTSGLILTIGGSTTAFGTLALDNAHFSSTQTNAPTISTPTNCGTTPAAAVTAGSTDSAGSFTITSGSGTPSNCDTVITFNQAYGSAPKSIILTPTIAVGGATISTDARVSAATTTNYTAQIDSPAASTAYSYYYWVVQ